MRCYSVRIFRIPYYLKNQERQVQATSVDPDQTIQNVASDQVLHCLPLIQQFLDISAFCNMNCSKIRTSMVRNLYHSLG